MNTFRRNLVLQLFFEQFKYNSIKEIITNKLSFLYFLDSLTVNLTNKISVN